MTLSAGRLRHRITIQSKSMLLDSNGDVQQDQQTGEVQYAWLDLAERWAAIEPLSGKEFIQSQGVQSRVTGRMVIRHDPNINAGMRILHGSEVFNIEAILKDRDSGLEYMTLLTSEGVNPEGA